MYLVVEFLKEEEIVTVPESWTTTDENGRVSSKWPMFLTPQRLSKAIERAEQPKMTWPMHEVQILYKTGIYTKAQEILAVLQLYKGHRETKDCIRDQQNTQLKSRVSRNSEASSTDSSYEELHHQGANIRRMLPPPPKSYTSKSSNRKLPSPVSFLQAPVKSETLRKRPAVNSPLTPPSPNKKTCKTGAKQNVGFRPIRKAPRGSSNSDPTVRILGLIHEINQKVDSHTRQLSQILQTTGQTVHLKPKY